MQFDLEKVLAVTQQYTDDSIKKVTDIESIPITWNPNLNLDSNKGASILKYGKMYFITYWFKATTSMTGSTPIIKLPSGNISIGNYVIAENNDNALWGGKTVIGTDQYCTIGGDITVGNFYRTQFIGMAY